MMENITLVVFIEYVVAHVAQTFEIEKNIIPIERAKR
jgi:hypothetical protein